MGAQRKSKPVRRDTPIEIELHGKKGMAFLAIGGALSAIGRQMAQSDDFKKTRRRR